MGWRIVIVRWNAIYLKPYLKDLSPEWRPCLKSFGPQKTWFVNLLPPVFYIIEACNALNFINRPFIVMRDSSSIMSMKMMGIPLEKLDFRLFLIL